MGRTGRFAFRNCATVFGFAAVVALLASTASAANCFGKLRGPLERGGYGPGVDCNDVDETIEYLGRTKSEHGPSYIVYLLSYRTKTHGWGVAHGGADIAIFDPQMNYLGRYRVMRGYRMRVVGTDVVLNVPDGEGNRLRLDGASPPETAWLDGDFEGFVK